MKINIVLHYQNAGKFYRLWANEENEINFFHEKDRATRCTLSFAATELIKYLPKVINDLEVTVSESLIKNCVNIELISLSKKSDHFTLNPIKSGIQIIGNNRAGVLYGVYELLNRQGIYFVEPGTIGEYIPEKRDELIIGKKQKFVTTGPEARGFALDGELNESDDLVLWMARHKLNSYFARPHTNALMHKLGFKITAGGHIFEKFLDPDYVLDSGTTIWESHKDWYGTPKDVELTKANALRTQFCVSNDELLKYLSECLIKKINTEWKDADEINVWGFDTWGGICSCPKCQAIGNGTDQNIYMLSKFRELLDKAYVEGRIDHNVKMILCLYEGTSTIEPPSKPIPKNVIKAKDHCLFAPIVRCYNHYFDDESCSYNKEYFNLLKGWDNLDRRMPISILEYYNVTKFEDMPLLFLKTMQHDFKAYYKTGVRGYNYMHIPMVAWGTRALTQSIYAALSWNVYCNVNKVISRYYKARYGMYTSSLKRAYKLIEKSSPEISSFRQWKSNSLLTSLEYWDGKKPTKELFTDDHINGEENAIKKLDEIISNLKKALRIVEKALCDAKNNPLNCELDISKVNNPDELLKRQNKNRLVKYLSDDKRIIAYGIDIHTLTNLIVRYHFALLNNDPSSDKLWKQVEACEKKLETYYYGVSYSNSCLGILQKDALTRSQLVQTIARCRANKHQ